MRLNDLIFLKTRRVYFIKKYRFLIFVVKFNVYYKKMTNFVRVKCVIQDHVKL